MVFSHRYAVFHTNIGSNQETKLWLLVKLILRSLSRLKEAWLGVLTSLYPRSFFLSPSAGAKKNGGGFTAVIHKIPTPLQAFASSNVFKV